MYSVELFLSQLYKVFGDNFHSFFIVFGDNHSARQTFEHFLLERSALFSPDGEKRFLYNLASFGGHVCKCENGPEIGGNTQFK